MVKEAVEHRVDPGCTADTSYAIRTAASELLGADLSQAKHCQAEGETLARSP